MFWDELYVVRLVKIEDEIVGYFTVSMNAIELDKLGKDEKVVVLPLAVFYLFLGIMDWL